MVEIRETESGDTLFMLDAPSLREAHLEGRNLTAADLSSARLAGTDLRNTNLNRADLSRADLHTADLRGATLEGATLGRANFSSADLRGSDMRRIAVSGANFSDADLRGADLRGSAWSRGLFHRVRLDGADLHDADLRGAYFSGWSPLYVLKTFASGVAIIFAMNLMIGYLWPASDWGRNPMNPFFIAFIGTGTGFIQRGLPVRLRPADFDGAIWDETTRWPWRFRPDTPPVPEGGKPPEQGV